MNAPRYADLAAALVGIEIPPEIIRTLALVDVPFFSFEGKREVGQLVIHQELATDIRQIFEELVEQQFSMQTVIPVAAFDWVDDASMEANNTSAFNYRRIVGTDMVSNHSLGLAIDVNPLQNPYYARDGKVYPAGAVYDPAAIGTITAESVAVRTFEKYGWAWLGKREANTDYQHFEKITI
jgi:peptidoglycan L-alanyl-D-glutamate endopeptidase CwlK